MSRLTLANLPIAALPVAAVPLAWLLPNHYYPWPSAWQDGLTLLLLCAAAITCPSRGAVPVAWVIAGVIALCSIGLQWVTGRILFGGDALLAAFYLICFQLAVGVGSALCSDSRETSRDQVLAALALGTLAGALASGFIALVQWSGTPSLGIYAADLRPGARPFANVAQANHLCTLSFLGICAAAQLRELSLLRPPVFWVATVLPIWSMVMSGSRTGWVQLLALAAIVFALRQRAPTRLGAAGAGVIVALFALGTWAWPSVNEIALLSGVRTDIAGLQGVGGRELLWPVILDAIGREPVWGYGWQQAFTAQLAVAAEHPAVLRHFEHTHNLLLDLMVWAGVPVGLTIGALMLVALARQMHAVTDPRVLWLVSAVLGVLLHAMFEFPLEFAYFLVPVGLALGAAHAIAPGSIAIAWPVGTIRMAGAALGLVLVLIAVDYFEAEQNHRLLRLESARIGVDRIETPAPKLRLLDQQQAFLEFARTEARPGMSAVDIEQMRRVAQRFGYPPVMFRYALAAGLNGQPEVASLTLQRLCRIHLPDRCREAHEAWAVLRERYPVLDEVRWR